MADLRHGLLELVRNGGVRAVLLRERPDEKKVPGRKVGNFAVLSFFGNSSLTLFSFFFFFFVFSLAVRVHAETYKARRG